MSPEPSSPTRFAQLGLGVTRLAVRNPRWTIAFAALFAIIAGVYATFELRFKTSRLDLLNPTSQYNQRWLKYLDAFGDDDDAVVVFEGPGQDRHASVEAFVTHLRGTSEEPLSILFRRDLPTGLQSKALHFASHQQRQEVWRQLQTLDQLTRYAPAAREDASGLRRIDIERWLQFAEPRGHGHEFESVSAFRRELLEAILRAMDDPPENGSQLEGWLPLGADSPDAIPSYLDDEQDRSFVLVQIGRNVTGEPDREAIDNVREAAREIARQSSAVTVGVTGMPLLETDEMQTSQRDMLQASLLSLLAVAALFSIGFGGLRYPLMAVACLLLAMAWSFGYITLAIGHLNLLSVSFGVILIGLGIDFGIHYLSRYLELEADSSVEPSRPAATVPSRRASRTMEQALLSTSRTVGPGILSGGITTSLAFFTAGLTRFTGVAELGLIAGGGILLCLLSALLVLPALISWFDRATGDTPQRSGSPSQSATREVSRLRALSYVPSARPRFTLCVAVGLCSVALFGLPRLEYDHNLLNLQAQSLESVRLERQLAEGSDQSVWFAVSYTSDLEELHRRDDAFSKLPTVARTESLLQALPVLSPSEQQTLVDVHTVAKNLGESSWKTSDFSHQRLGRLRQTLERSAAEAEDAGRTHEANLMRQIIERLQRLPPMETASRLTRLQESLGNAIRSQTTRLAQRANPTPPQVEDLSGSLTDRFVGDEQQLLLKVFARGDIWDIESLQRFVRDIESVDPEVTGHPVQTFYASREMQRSYVNAGWYALLAVSIVLMLDFRRIRLCMLALVPVLAGLLCLFGILGLLQIPLNPANLIVLPLILGIGIDDGVHVVHDYVRHGHSADSHQGSIYRLGNATLRAIVLTSATTMCGFGSMMIADHRGLRSLGLVLTLGVACCLITSLFVLPALLALGNRRRSHRATQVAHVDTNVETSGTRPTDCEHDSSLAEPPRQVARRRLRRRSG